MEEEMIQAEQKMAEDRKRKEEDVPIKQEIATPGLNTPRRTPHRLGLWFFYTIIIVVGLSVWGRIE